MINICRSDLYRLVRGKSAYIIILVTAFFMAISLFQVAPGMILNIGFGHSDASNILSKIPAEEYNSMSLYALREYMLSCDDYCLERDYLSQNINLYYAFVVLAFVIITSDFSAGSVKNTLSSAISRNRYYFSKVGFTLFACAAFTLLNDLAFHAAGVIFNGKSYLTITETFEVYMYQFPIIMALAGIVSGLAFICRKASFYNGLAIPFILICQLVFALYGSLAKVDDKYAEYELSSSMYNVLHEPSDTYLYRVYLLCFVIFAFFISTSYFSFKKAEIR